MHDGPIVVDRNVNFERDWAQIHSGGGGGRSGLPVPYLDIRDVDAHALDEVIGRFVEHTRRSPIAAIPWLRGLVIARPQNSDALSLKLAPHGLLLTESPQERPLEQLLAELEQQFQRLQGAAVGWSSGKAGTSGQDPSTPGSPTGAPGPDSPYAQKPAYYNQALYEQWLTRLSEPWREEDAWKSES